MSSSHSDNKSSVIYVGDIPANITKDEIYTVFSQIDPNIQIDPTTGPKVNSDTYHCLITFKDHAKAMKAIDEYNYAKLDGKTIRVSMKEDIFDPAADLVISNLSDEVDEKFLHDNLNTYGDIISCKILRNREGRSRGMGYVQFRTKADADRARSELKDAEIEGKKIVIEQFLPKGQRQEIPKILPSNVVAICPADNLSEEAINQQFSVFGQINNIIKMQDHAIIFYRNETDAAKALQEFKSETLTIKRQVHNDIAKKANEMNDRCSIFITDLTIPDSEKDKLKIHLDKYGDVLSFLYEPNKRAPNFFMSTVRYSTPEARDNALNNLDHFTFEGQTLPLRVQPFINKGTEHCDAGLAIFPSLPLTIRYNEFRNRMKSYGPIVTTSIIPTFAGQCIGYALFQKYEDAQSAKSFHHNSFVIPQFSLLKLDFPFTTMSSETICGVIAYKCNSIDVFNGLENDRTDIRVVQDNAIAFFNNMQSAGKAFEAIRKQNIEAEVFFPQIADGISKILYYTVLPNELKNRLLFVTNLQSTFTNQQIYDYFSKIGPVEFAYQFFISNDGQYTDKAIVLMANANDANEAINNPPTIPGSLVMVARYTNDADKKGYVNKADAQSNAVVLTPEMLKAPKATLRNIIFEELKQESQNIPEEKFKLIQEQIKLSVKTEPSNDDVIKMLRMPDERKNWIEKHKQKWGYDIIQN